MVEIAVLGVIDPDDDPLSIAIDWVRQDEPVQSPGSGAFGPDAIFGPDGTVWLRAEREGGGDGRVYRIGLTATDSPHGATCSAVIEVAVPKSPKKAPVNSGATHDSTVALTPPPYRSGKGK